MSFTESPPQVLRGGANAAPDTELEYQQTIIHEEDGDSPGQLDVKVSQESRTSELLRVGSHSASVDWNALKSNLDAFGRSEDNLDDDFLDSSAIPPPKLEKTTLIRKKLRKMSIGSSGGRPPIGLNEAISSAVRDRLGTKLLGDKGRDLDPIYETSNRDIGRGKFVFHFLKCIAYTSTCTPVFVGDPRETGDTPGSSHVYVLHNGVERVIPIVFHPELHMPMLKYVRDIRQDDGVVVSLASYLGFTLISRSETKMDCWLNTVPERPEQSLCRFHVLTRSSTFAANVEIVVGYFEGDEQIVLYATGHFASLVPYLGISNNSKQSLKRRISYLADQGIKTLIAGYKSLQTSEARVIEKAIREDSSLQINVFESLNKALARVIKNIRYLGIVNIRREWSDIAYDYLIRSDCDGYIPSNVLSEADLAQSCPRRDVEKRCLIISNQPLEIDSIALMCSCQSESISVYNLRKRWKAVNQREEKGQENMLPQTKRRKNRRLRGTHIKKEFINVLNDFASFIETAKRREQPPLLVLVITNELLLLFLHLSNMQSILVYLIQTVNIVLLHRVELCNLSEIITILQSRGADFGSRISICGITYSPYVSRAISGCDVVVGMDPSDWCLRETSDVDKASAGELSLAIHCHILAKSLEAVKRFAWICTPAFAHRYKRIVLWAAHTQYLALLPNVIYDFNSSIHASTASSAVIYQTVVPVLLLPIGFFRIFRQSSEPLLTTNHRPYNRSKYHRDVGWRELVMNFLDSVLCGTVTIYIARYTEMKSAWPSNGKVLSSFQSMVVTSVCLTSICRFLLLETFAFRLWPHSAHRLHLVWWVASLSTLAALGACIGMVRLSYNTRALETAPGCLTIFLSTILCCVLTYIVKLITSAMVNPAVISMVKKISDKLRKLNEKIPISFGGGTAYTSEPVNAQEIKQHVHLMNSQLNKRQSDQGQVRRRRRLTVIDNTASSDFTGRSAFAPYVRPASRPVKYSDELSIARFGDQFGANVGSQGEIHEECVYDDVSVAELSVGEELIASEFLRGDSVPESVNLESDEELIPILTPNGSYQNLRLAKTALLRQSTTQPKEAKQMHSIGSEMSWVKLEFSDPKLESLYRYSCNTERENLRAYYVIYFLLMMLTRAAGFVSRWLANIETNWLMWTTFAVHMAINGTIGLMSFTNVLFDHFRVSMYLIGLCLTICTFIDRLNMFPLYPLLICHATWLFVISRAQMKDATVIGVLHVLVLCLWYYLRPPAYDKTSRSRSVAFAVFLVVNEMGSFAFMFVTGARLALTRRQKFLMNFRVELGKVKKRDILTNMLPAFVVDKMLKNGVNELGVPIGMSAICPGTVTVIFCDVYDFQNLVKKLEPTQLVSLLDSLFLYFDRLIDSFAVIKIETVFETYLSCSGLRADGTGTAEEYTLRDCFAALDFALTQLQVVANITYNVRDDDNERSQYRSVDDESRAVDVYTNIQYRRERLHVKIGMNTGPVIAGVVGGKKPQYALFGDTVNTASRMKLTGEKDRIHVSDSTYEYLKDDASLSWIKQTIPVKGKGIMDTYLLNLVQGTSYPDFVDSSEDEWMSLEDLSLESESDEDVSKQDGPANKQRKQNLTLETMPLPDTRDLPFFSISREDSARHGQSFLEGSHSKRRRRALKRLLHPYEKRTNVHLSSIPHHGASRGSMDAMSSETEDLKERAGQRHTVPSLPSGYSVQARRGTQPNWGQNSYMNPRSTFLERRHSRQTYDVSRQVDAEDAATQQDRIDSMAESALDKLAIEKAIQSQKESHIQCKESLNPLTLWWKDHAREREYREFVRKDSTHVTYTMGALIVFLLMRALIAIARIYSRYDSDILQIIPQQPENPVTNLILGYWAARSAELVCGFIAWVMLHRLTKQRHRIIDSSGTENSEYTPSLTSISSPVERKWPHFTTQLCAGLYICSVFSFIMLPGWDFGKPTDQFVMPLWKWSTDIVELSSLLLVLHHSNGFMFTQLLLFDVFIMVLMIIYLLLVFQNTIATRITIIVLPFVILLVLLSAYCKESIDRHSWFIINRSLHNADKANEMLVDMLPKQVLEEFQNDQLKLAYYHNDITFLFADIVGFTDYSSSVTPHEVVNLLQRLFAAFDHDSTRFNLFKLCTIGDAYVAVSDPPTDRQTNYDPTPGLINAMLANINEIRSEFGVAKLNMRIGCHLGSCVGGVIGSGRIRYDFWGMDVLIGNSMESNGTPGKINVSETWKRFVETHLPTGAFDFEFNKTVDVQGETIDCYFAIEVVKVLREIHDTTPLDLDN